MVDLKIGFFFVFSSTSLRKEKEQWLNKYSLFTFFLSLQWISLLETAISSIFYNLFLMVCGLFPFHLVDHRSMQDLVS